MVSFRGFSCLLLALAAAPGVLSTAVVEAEAVAIVDRQGSAASSGSGSGSGASASASASSPSSPSASAPTSDTPSVSATPTPTSVPANTPTSISPTSESPSSTAGPTSTAANSPSSSNNSPTTAAPSTPTSNSQVRTSVLVQTASDGHQTTDFVIQTIVTTTGGATLSVAAFTSDSLPTETANAAAATATSDPSTGSQGISTGAIVGIVVGTVGGVILLGSLAAVAWRVWGKNRRSADEDDGLMGENGYGTSEVNTGFPATSDSPFKSHLEQHHAAGPSANF